MKPLAPLLSSALMLVVAGSAQAQPAANAPPPVAVGTRIADGQSYATMVELKHQPDPANNGHLLLTFQSGSPGMPIWESSDHGVSWHFVATAHDPSESDKNCDLRSQPHLTEMPRSEHGVAAGTVLLSASSSCQVPQAGRGGGGRNMHLRLFRSADLGKSWNYISTYADAANGLPVWEPHLVILEDGSFVEFYSDETRKSENYNQMLGHKVSKDGGQTWGPEIFDVAVPDGVDRPGMVMIDRVPQKGFVYIFEDVSGPVQNRLYIKFSADGLNFGKPTERGIPVQTESGQYPMYTPSIRWFPIGGPKGVLVATSRDIGGPAPDPAGNVIFWNNNLGVGPWWQAPSPVQKLGSSRAGYTQAMVYLGDGKILHVSSSALPANGAAAPGTEMLANIAAPDFHRYEAENAQQKGTALMRDPSMSNGAKARLGAKDGRLTFHVTVPKAGTYALGTNYIDLGYEASPGLMANGKPVTATVQALPLDPVQEAKRARDLGTRGDGIHKELRGSVALKAGDNTIEITGGAHGLDIDYLEVTPP